VAANFKYGYAQQANLTIEQHSAIRLSFSVSYQYSKGLHLNRPVDVNSTDPKLLDQNALNAAASGLSVSNPITVVVPSGVPNSCVNTSTGSIFLIAPGALGQGFAAANCNPLAAVGYVATPAFFNFFRPSGPNPSFAVAAGGYANEVGLAQTRRLPCWLWRAGSVQQCRRPTLRRQLLVQRLDLNVQKRFSKNFQMLSSYTWSHSIDNGTDLQSTLEPQDSRFANLERANSVNDSASLVTSAVFKPRRQRAATASGSALSAASLSRRSSTSPRAGRSTSLRPQIPS